MAAFAEVDLAGVPFDEAIAYLRGKVDVPSLAWTDLKEAAHARAFTVAGATTVSLVQDFHDAATRAIAEGRTLADFRADFDRIVQAHGWSYKGGRGWRSAVIYNTNMRMARSAGRWAQAQRLAEQERARGRQIYLRYVAVLDDRTRDLHRSWHGIVLPIDHPFWSTHTPPNGWNCRCTIMVLTERALKRFGYVVTPDSKLPSTVRQPRPVNTPFGRESWPTPAGIDTGFGYNPGASWLAQGVTPAELDRPLPDGMAVPAPAGLPRLRPSPVAPGRILPAELSEEDYVDAFLAEFGAARGRAVGFRDAAGHQIAIGEDLFVDRTRSRADGQARFKVRKRDRARYLLLLADALKTPDEIWLDWAGTGGGQVLRRRYIKALDLPERAGALSVFEWSDAGWHGVTVFPPDAEEDMARGRHGQLLYRRPETRTAP